MTKEERKGKTDLEVTQYVKAIGANPGMGTLLKSMWFILFMVAYIFL